MEFLKNIIFDNLKPAVKKILKENQRELQTEFLKFKSYYCFEAIFCAPGKGNEKGLIENLIKYVKNNYFLPRLEFFDYENLNAYLIKKCRTRLEKGQYKRELWTKRLLRENFMQLKDIYQYARIKEAKVDTYQLIHLERNRYSVPTRYVGKRVQINIYPFKITITYKGELIAEHERLFGRNKEHLDPYHYLSLLRKKTRAYEQAKVISDWQLPPIYNLYHKRLQAHLQSKSKGTREFIDILKLTEEHTIKTIEKILKDLDEKNLYGCQNVLSLLRYQTQCTNGTSKLAEDKVKTLDLRHIKTTYLPLDNYNDLIKEGERVI